MKTYEQLMKHYWGVIVSMAAAAGINPWECVRLKDPLAKFATHPVFQGNLSNYTFALTVLEGKPVFVDNVVYSKSEGVPLTIHPLLHPSTFINIGNHYTWTPPTKKRTFMLGDKELPCPVRTESDYWFMVAGETFYFDRIDDRANTHKTIREFLEKVRDQE